MQQVSEKEKQLQEIFGLFANLQDTNPVSNDPLSKFNKEKHQVEQRQQGKIYAKTIPIILRHLGQIPPDYEEVITEIINFRGEVENDPGQINKILENKAQCEKFETTQLDYDDFMIIYSKLNKVQPPNKQELKEALLTLAKEINDSQSFQPPLKYMPDPNSKEPKKTDPNSQEPKKTDPNSKEPKKTDPNSQEPKKTDPNSQEPKKTDPNSKEPKKTDPNSKEPKKTDPNPKKPKKPDSNSKGLKKPFPTKASPGKIKAFDFKRILTTMCDKMTPEEVDELLAKIPTFQRFIFKNENEIDPFDYQYEREAKEEEKQYLQNVDCELDIDQIVEVLTRIPIDPLNFNS